MHLPLVVVTSKVSKRLYGIVKNFKPAHRRASFPEKSLVGAGLPAPSHPAQGIPGVTVSQMSPNPLTVSVALEGAAAGGQGSGTPLSTDLSMTVQKQGPGIIRECSPCSSQLQGVQVGMHETTASPRQPLGPVALLACPKCPHHPAISKSLLFPSACMSCPQLLRIELGAPQGTPERYVAPDRAVTQEAPGVQPWPRRGGAGQPVPRGVPGALEDPSPLSQAREEAADALAALIRMAKGNEKPGAEYARSYGLLVSRYISRLEDLQQCKPRP